MLTFYRILTTLLGPFIRVYLFCRRITGKEDPSRFAERLGHASLPRPEGKLLWCHAASVGEMMSVITLLRELRARHKDLAILLTTGTVTSARLSAARLPAGVIHQYVPVDRQVYVTRFFDHWRPDFALWIESELWPNMLASLSSRGIPAALINARMSDRSFTRWRVALRAAEKLLSAFDVCLAQTEEDAARFSDLGHKNVRAAGNLKYAADPLPCDEKELAALRAAIGSRPAWLMASTHEGEELIALDVHIKLAARHPDILTIIVPRHPARGEKIAALIEAHNLPFAQRSKGADPSPQTAVYLADTLGELGLFYRLTGLVCLAGSFAWGGHNPIEPAQLGCAVLFGPRMDNFAVMTESMLSCRAARKVQDTEDLSTALQSLMESPAEATKLGEAAGKWALSKRNILDETLKTLDPFLTAAKARS